MEILILGAALIALASYTTWLHFKQRKAEFERQLFEALWDTMWDTCEAIDDIINGDGLDYEEMLTEIQIKNRWMMDVLNCEADPGFEIQIEGYDDER